MMFAIVALWSCHDDKELKGVDVISEGHQQAVREWHVQEISIIECISSHLGNIGGKKEGVSDSWVSLDDGDTVVLRKEGTPPA